jgi:hypothetical protein
MCPATDQGVVVEVLRYGQDYTAAGICCTTLKRATDTFRAANAFNEPGSDDRLVAPSPA